MVLPERCLFYISLVLQSIDKRFKKHIENVMAIECYLIECNQICPIGSDYINIHRTCWVSQRKDNMLIGIYDIWPILLKLTNIIFFQM